MSQTSQAAIAVARQRLQTIMPLLQLRVCSALGAPLALDGREFRNMEEAVGFYGARFGVCRSTLWNWYSGFVSDGFDSLVRYPRADRGCSTFFKNNCAADVFARRAFRRRWSARHTHTLL